MRRSIGVLNKVYPNKITIDVPDLMALSHNYKGDYYHCEGINELLTIYETEDEKYIYQVVGMYEKEKPYLPEEDSKFGVESYFEAIPLGKIEENKFHFGLSKFPMIGKDVYLTALEDVKIIFESQSGGFDLQLGPLTTLREYEPVISIDHLFTHHMSILGNTGSGKSTTSRTLLHMIEQKIEKGELNPERINFLIFDVHDEYGIEGAENHEVVELEDLVIDLKTLEESDWINLVNPSDGVQLPVLLQAIRLAPIVEEYEKWLSAYCALEMYLNVRTDVLGTRRKIISLGTGLSSEVEESLNTFNSQYGNLSGSDEKKFLSEFAKIIQQQQTDDEWNHSTNCNELGAVQVRSIREEATEKLQEQLDESSKMVINFTVFKRAIEFALLLEEVKGNNQVRSYCSTLITRIEVLEKGLAKVIFSEDTDKITAFNEIISCRKPFTTLRVSGLEDDELLFLTSYILRRVFQEQKEERQERKEISKLRHFLFDEAHLYINERSNDQFGKKSLVLDIFEKVAKEGRKYGMFMILSSQRPSEISKTVLSQCNNYILHRVRSDVDLEQMRRSIPYLTDHQLHRLSYLETGTALLVGEAFPIPFELDIDGEEHGLVSETKKPSNMWA